MLRIISGQWKGIKIHEVDRDQTRPTTDKNKESLFNSLGQYFEGGSVLDLYAGSGALGFEALSRGMDYALFIDKAQPAIRTIHQNAQLLKLHPGIDYDALHADVLSTIHPRINRQFALILADPPYQKELAEHTLQWIDQRNLLEPDGLIVIESLKSYVFTHIPERLEIIKEKTSGITKFSYFQLRR
jgi:16S rRNA (guanine(966)-N(2))-methyltransferase RsmD